MKFTCLTLILLSTLTFTANSHNYDFKIVPKPSHIEPAKSSFVVRDAFTDWNKKYSQLFPMRIVA